MNYDIDFYGSITVGGPDENVAKSRAVQMIYDRLKQIDGFSYIKVGHYPTCDVRICRVSDWEAMYVNGHMVLQNHKLELSDVMMCLKNVGNITFTSEWCDEKVIEQHGFPSRYEDLHNENK